MMGGMSTASYVTKSRQELKRVLSGMPLILLVNLLFIFTCKEGFALQIVALRPMENKISFPSKRKRGL